jgi:hypothetical protein
VGRRAPPGPHARVPAGTLAAHTPPPGGCPSRCLPHLASQCACLSLCVSLTVSLSLCVSHSCFSVSLSLCVSHSCFSHCVSLTRVSQCLSHCVSLTRVSQCFSHCVSQILAPLLRVVLVIAAALPESAEVAMQVRESAPRPTEGPIETPEFQGPCLKPFRTSN